MLAWEVWGAECDPFYASVSPSWGDRVSLRRTKAVPLGCRNPYTGQWVDFKGDPDSFPKDPMRPAAVTLP